MGNEEEVNVNKRKGATLFTMRRRWLCYSGCEAARVANGLFHATCRTFVNISKDRISSVIFTCCVK